MEERDTRTQEDLEEEERLRLPFSDSYNSTTLMAHSDSNGTNITHVLSPMTTSLEEGSGVRKEGEEEDRVIYNMYNIAATGEEDSNASAREASLYIVSEGVREYNGGMKEYNNSNGGSNSSRRKQQYLVERRGEVMTTAEDEDGGFSSSPSSPNNSQALITHKSNLKSGARREKHVNWPGYPPQSATSRRELTHEPSCFHLFRWCLILIGLVMLISVLVIMGQLLVDWGHGRAGGHVPNLAARQQAGGTSTFSSHINATMDHSTDVPVTSTTSTSTIPFPTTSTIPSTIPSTPSISHTDTEKDR